MLRRVQGTASICSSSPQLRQQVCQYTVTAKEIQALRWKTEAPMTDCKKALLASDGNMEESIKWLQRQGAAKAVKKGDRVTDHGMLLAAVSNQGKGAAIIQVCSETDFALRNDRYLEFTSVVRQKAVEHLESVKHGLTEEYGLTSEEHSARVAAMLEAIQSNTDEARKQAIGVLGENITVKQMYAMPNLSADQAKSVISVPSGAVAGEPIIPHHNFYGYYCHNTPNMEHRYLGSIVSIVQLQPRKEDGKGLPNGTFRQPEVEDASVEAEMAEAASDTGKKTTESEDPPATSATAISTLEKPFIQTSELAQHCVANVFNDSPITQQKLLGTDENAGQWMKRHGVKLQRAMIVQMGKEPVIHTIEAPFEGKK